MSLFKKSSLVAVAVAAVVAAPAAYGANSATGEGSPSNPPSAPSKLDGEVEAKAGSWDYIGRFDTKKECDDVGFAWVYMGSQAWKCELGFDYPESSRG